jgi:hypothetical protein
MEDRSRHGATRRYAIQIHRAAGEFSRLPVEVQALLRLCDGTRSVRTLRADSGLSPSLFGRVLYRLVTLGLVGPASEQADRPARAARAVAWSREVGSPMPADPLADIDPLGQTVRIELATEDTLEIPRPDAAELAPALPVEISAELIDFSLDEEAFFARTIDHLLEPEERAIPLE